MWHLCRAQHCFICKIRKRLRIAPIKWFEEHLAAKYAAAASNAIKRLGIERIITWNPEQQLWMTQMSKTCHHTPNAKRNKPYPTSWNSKTSSVASYNIWTNMLSYLSLSFSIMIYHFQCSDVSLNGIQWVCWVCTLIQIPEFMQGTATAGHGLPRPNGGVVTLGASVDPQYIVMVRNATNLPMSALN